MNTKRLFTFCILFITAVSPWCYGNTSSGKANDSVETTQRAIIFISDTQAPMWFEKIFVKTHRNEEATKILLNTIASDTAISSVFFLGDMTAMSSFDFHWATIDSFLTSLKMRQIPAYSVAGNHDYLLSSYAGETNLRRRFPDFRRTGYTIRSGSFAMVLLNSNFGELNQSEEVQQEEWYLHELQFLENDSTIKLIAVGCHHSPFSNSTIVGHSQQVRDKLVPPFKKSGKCRLFISGHAHTFQHFSDTVANKHFLVIGGGGGLLHTLKPEEPDDLRDQIQWDSADRLFHFVRAVFTNEGMLLNVQMLNEDLSGPQSVYKLFIPFDNR